MKLTEEQIQERLPEIPEWSLDGKRISRRFRFSSFPEAVRFVGAVAEVAERRNHHPFISIDYKVVTLQLTTWHAGGLTELDFEEAKELDELYDRMKPESG
ncbi:MAG: 4a-hydroxytetrahydrobiopterin dehydratase [Alicyclobacillaceae bacterium]|nr:4a-hydroxytetrahydrobiopterin dehydratase [Alicyclobacillaceae bacterium]